MEQILEWLSTWDFSAVMTVAITFVSTNAIALITLVIGFLKTRISNVNVKNTLNAMGINLQDEQNKKLEEIRSSILAEMQKTQQTLIEQNADALKARQDYIKSIVDDAKKANDEINSFLGSKEVVEEKKTKSENIDVNSFLSSL